MSKKTVLFSPDLLNNIYCRLNQLGKFVFTGHLQQAHSLLTVILLAQLFDLPVKINLPSAYLTEYTRVIFFSNLDIWWQQLQFTTPHLSFCYLCFVLSSATTRRVDRCNAHHASEKVFHEAITVPFSLCSRPSLSPNCTQKPN